jgi:hypothetical protein
MAFVALTATTRSSDGSPFALTKTTLGAVDTYTINYVQGNGQILEITNGTGGSLNVVLVGATAPATTVVTGPPGAGGTTISTASKTVAVAAGATQVILLDNLRAYLIGAVTMTATGVMTATLLNS